MSNPLAEMLARRRSSPQAIFADQLPRAAAAIRKRDDKAARDAVAQLPLEPISEQVLPTFDRAADSPLPASLAAVLACGFPASPGAAVGRLAFTAVDAVDRAAKGESIILVRPETFAGDMEAIRQCAGVLTTTGGMMSHAAVVARGWGKPCVSGAKEIKLDVRKGTLRAAGRTFTAKDTIAIDGATGEVFDRAIPVRSAELSADLRAVLKWADKHARMTVYGNADSPTDATLARQLGARGIGLCRTEHMFFEPHRLLALRRMILAETPEQRGAALDELHPYQKDDFAGMFRAMDGLAVTIRLLDPPLHEFLPHEGAALTELARALKAPLQQVKARAAALREVNPMLGHRGCRLCVTWPPILRMQVGAIAEALIDCRAAGIDARAQILHPLVSAAAEMQWLREQSLQTIAQCKGKRRQRGKLAIPIGAMIETPRAALIADELVLHSDFLSFGTNDLTQLAFGFSRDDAGAFLPGYVEQGLLPADPFDAIDVAGVGELMRITVEKARRVKPNLPIGVCGEHGARADTIALCERLGMDYVSCSPFRVPAARLAAAQAILRD